MKCKPGQPAATLVVLPLKSCVLVRTRSLWSRRFSIITSNGQCVVSCSGRILWFTISEGYTKIWLKKKWLKLSLCLWSPTFLKSVKTWWSSGVWPASFYEYSVFNVACVFYSLNSGLQDGLFASHFKWPHCINTSLGRGLCRNNLATELTNKPTGGTHTTCLLHRRRTWANTRTRTEDKKDGRWRCLEPAVWSLQDGKLTIQLRFEKRQRRWV